MSRDLCAARAAALDADSILHYLRVVRSIHAPINPLEVYTLSKRVLETKKRLPEADLWALREDHCIACIQLGKSGEALSIVNMVHERFPKSCRAARLKGMYLESVSKSDEAEGTYKAALQVDPDNLMIVHRLAALRKGRGDIAGALDDLHKHLDGQLGDYQAWYEAGRLHARQGAYEKAVFCFEEVLMHQPGDFQMHLILADCLYALGGAGRAGGAGGTVANEQIRLAKTYYANVVEMSGGTNVKALLGLCQCIARERGVEGGEGGVGGEGKNLGTVASEALLSEYALKGGPWAGAMARVLSR